MWYQLFNTDDELVEDGFIEGSWEFITDHIPDFFRGLRGRVEFAYDKDDFERGDAAFTASLDY